jgi:hypothetical protein
VSFLDRSISPLSCVRVAETIFNMRTSALHGSVGQLHVLATFISGIETRRFEFSAESECLYFVRLFTCVDTEWILIYFRTGGLHLKLSSGL